MKLWSDSWGNGDAIPDRLAAVLPLVDWIGFDVKAPFERYDSLTGVPGSARSSRRPASATRGAGFGRNVAINAMLNTARMTMAA